MTVIHSLLTKSGGTRELEGYKSKRLPTIGPAITVHGGQVLA